MTIKNVLAFIGGCTVVYLFGSAAVATIDAVLVALGRK